MSQVVAPAAAPASAPNVPAPSAAPEASQPSQPQNTAPKSQPKAETYEVMMDGKPVTMTLDEMKQAASLGSAANKRFQEAAQMRKQAETILQRLKSPDQALELLNDPRLGLDPEGVQKAFEKWYHSKVIEPSKLTPEQRELAQAKDRLKKFEDQEAAQKKSEEERRTKEENERIDQETLQRIQDDFISILRDYNLPNHSLTRSRVAYWTRQNEIKGINAPKELIVQQVRKEIRAAMEDMVRDSEGETLLNLLGESTAKKLRKYDIQRLRAKKGAPPAPEAPKQVDDDKEPTRRTMPYVKNFR